MTNPVSAASGQTVGIDPTLLASSRADAGPSKAMDKEAFLKLLVAQLKYQDPMNPSSNEQFIATTAQFTTIEKLDELAQQNAASAHMSALATAGALVGRQVSISTDDGTTLTANVLKGQYAGGLLSVVTDAGTFPLDQVSAIGAGSTPAPTTRPRTEPADPVDPAPEDQNP